MKYIRPGAKRHTVIMNSADLEKALSAVATLRSETKDRKQFMQLWRLEQRLKKAVPGQIQLTEIQAGLLSFASEV